MDDTLLDVPTALERARTQDGRTLKEMSDAAPLLVVFLRHLGCTFCREALADTARLRREIEGAGARIALVHMASEAEAGNLFREYGLADAARVSDPGQWLYKAFRLRRGGPMALFGPAVWRRGLEALRAGHGIGRLMGDGRQLAGVFLVFRGEILKEYRHTTAADRPDLLSLALGPTPANREPA